MANSAIIGQFIITKETGLKELNGQDIILNQKKQF